MRLFDFIFKRKKEVIKQETMPDFQVEYRITSKYGKYRLESFRKMDDKWVPVTRIIDTMDEAREVRDRVIKQLTNDWIAKHDMVGWVVVE